MPDIFNDDGLPGQVTPDIELAQQNAPPDQGTTRGEIDVDAGYFTPVQYLQYLTYYYNFQVQYDSASTGFFPLTATRGNPKTFAVGIIPPNANITIPPTGTGTQSTTQQTQQAAALAVQQANTPPKGGTGVNTQGNIQAALSNLGQLIPSKYGDANFNTLTAGAYNPSVPLSSSCGYVASYYLQSLGVTDPTIINRDIPSSGAKSTPGANLSKLYFGAQKAGALRTVAKDGPPPPGSVLFFGDPKDPTGNYAAQHVSVLGSVNSDGSFNTLDGGSPSREQTSQNTRSFTTGVDADGNPTNTISSGAGPRTVMAYIDVTALPIAAPPAPPSIGGLVNFATLGLANWNTTGSPNAQQAAQVQSIVANTSINLTSSQVTQQYQAAQAAEATTALSILNTMAQTPPLRMLVNPKSFKVDAQKIISDGNYTRKGPIIEHWGDGQDKIEGSGKIAGFYAASTLNGPGPGLSRSARNYSVSYQNFLSLWLLYRNNGGLYYSGQVQGETPKRIWPWSDPSTCTMMVSCTSGASTPTTSRKTTPPRSRSSTVFRSRFGRGSSLILQIRIQRLTMGTCRLLGLLSYPPRVYKDAP